MFPLILAGLAAWAIIASVACVAACMAAARFNREAEQHDGAYESSLSMPHDQPEPRHSLAPQRSRS